MKNLAVGFVCVIGIAGTVVANDTVAEISAGGLRYVQSQNIQMVREDLYISKEEVRVDYIFHNSDVTDIRAMVAFPMPQITPDPFSDIGIPYNNDNFLGFSVSVDGENIQPALQQRAIVLGVDITPQLVKRGIPLFPASSHVAEVLEAQNAQTISDLEQIGAVIIDSYDVGQGMEHHPFPNWSLNSAYYWEMDFPAGKDIHVSHTYTPAVGATTGLSSSFFDGEPVSADYAERYCVDEGFVRATHQRIDGGAQFFENWISYILTTGQNWSGSIGTFHLTVDKGSVDNLVSFCGEGVSKTGPTTFELTIEDYYPNRELEILLLHAVEF